MAKTNVSPEKSTEPRKFRGAGGLAENVLNSHHMGIGIQKVPSHSKIQLNIFIHKNSLLILLLHNHKNKFMRTLFFD